MENIGGVLCGLAGFGFLAFMVLWPTFLRGFFVVEPGQAFVLFYWGKYSQTLEGPGLHWVFPIGMGYRQVSTREAIFPVPLTTVVDSHGTPVQVSAVCVYRVEQPARAVIDVEDYKRFIASQASTVLKTVCSRYPYEAGSDGCANLKDESQESIEGLQDQLQQQVHGAGVRVLLVRLNDLCYAPEIAQSMLLRQQAQAMVDARRTLVEGAVATVREGLGRLDEAGVRLSAEIRTRLQANLVLLLCAGERGEAHSTVVSRQRPQH